MLPIELTQFPHWVLWRIEERDGKPTKVPYQPRTLYKASPTDPEHWAPYADALAAYQDSNGAFNGLGFVLSEQSPYSIIDLDNPGDDQEAIERALRWLGVFESYTEVSQSGAGFHIIVRGKVPTGVRKGKIEVYSEGRFFALTGNTYKDLPIVQSDFLLIKLWEELGGAFTVGVPVNDRTQTITDEEVFNRASKGHTMFQDLFFGRWQLHYASQSEADFALVNLISFYSGNRDQIARMFYFSELGKRPKAHRRGRSGKPGYLDDMINKSFDNRVPDITLDVLMGNLQQQITEMRKQQVAAPAPMLGQEWVFPPGLVGDIAEFIYQQAPRPVREIALAASIGLMAGICGQAYNISATGLNQYILVLAETGRGKEAMKSGIGKLMRHVSNQLPNASQFIGPAEIASGQALVRYLSSNSGFISLVGEFGLTMQQICSPHASHPQVQLRKVILDLYNKSGKTDTLDPTIYADKSNNTAIIHSPSLTILGETTPDSFFPYMDEYAVAQGLLPRFTCIEYVGKRMPLNKAHSTIEPSAELIEKLIILCQNALTLRHHGEAISVGCEADATQLFEDFDKHCDDMVNGAEIDVVRHLWSRAHMKLLKLAALVAVGMHPFEPAITLEVAQWSKHLIERDVANILNRFETGTVGRDNEEQTQIREMSTLIRDYCARPYDVTMENYGVDQNMHRDKVLQWSYICRRLYQRPAFKNDRMGSKFSVLRCITQMVDIGAASELTLQQVGQRYNKSGKAFMILDLSKVG